METRHIGALEVSVIGLGCNNFGGRLNKAETATVVNAALDAGVNYFDTADSYGDTLSEEYLGAALAGKRDEAVIATKFGNRGSADGSLTNGDPKNVRQSVDESLRRLRVDAIDHYQFHRPDPAVPLEETLGAMSELVTAGKVREIGCSNFDVSQLEEANALSAQHGWARFVTVQNHYSIFHRQPEDSVVEACKELNISLVPYFPLESGLLTGKVSTKGQIPADTRLASMPEERRSHFITDNRLAAIGRLTEFAGDHGHSLLDLAFAYLLSEPVVVSVIAGATKPEQVETNAAVANWRLTSDERSEVASIAG